jgi:hypothetical protein
VEKSGFYSSRVSLHPDDLKGVPFDIVLRKIAAPVMLHGKQAFVELPQNSGAAGYDLLKGDLVPPYGSGETEDLKIVWRKPERNHAQNRFDSYDFVTLNNKDGFVALHIPYNDGRVSKSDFHTLYEAPETGYVSGLRESAKNTGKELRDTFVYYFRIRSQSSSGPVYGKLVSGPNYHFYNDGNAFRFVYMVNTTGSRNMEPDIQRSTAPRLGDLEYSLQSSTELENK